MVGQKLDDSTHLAPVLQKMDNTIHRINNHPLDNAIGLTHTYHWIVIYPMDGVIQVLSNSSEIHR